MDKSYFLSGDTKLWFSLLWIKKPIFRWVKLLIQGHRARPMEEDSRECYWWELTGLSIHLQRACAWFKSLGGWSLCSPLEYSSILSSEILNRQRKNGKAGVLSRHWPWGTRVLGHTECLWGTYFLRTSVSWSSKMGTEYLLQKLVMKVNWSNMSKTQVSGRS